MKPPSAAFGPRAAERGRRPDTWTSGRYSCATPSTSCRAFACACSRRRCSCCSPSACSRRALVYLQIGKHDELSTQAENNRIAVVPIAPNRGLILDRNGIVLANNYSAYTLEIAPAKVRRPRRRPSTGWPRWSTSSRATGKRFKRLLEESKSLESLPIRTKLTDEEVARFTAQRFRFEGVDIKARLFRNYPLGEVGSHLIGYIGRINAAEKKAIERLGRRPARQLPRHRVHRQARRRAELRGRAARHHRLRGGGDERRRPRRCGACSSSPATPGNALVLSIDIRLQALVEELFGDRRGALVAIDPRNGEILRLRQQAELRPQPVRRRHRLRELEGAERVARQAAAQPRAARHLSAGLDLQAVHGDGRADARQAHAAADDLRSRLLQLRQPLASATTRKAATARSTCTSRSCSRATPTTTRSPTTSGVDAIHDFMAPLGFGQMTGIDLQGELRGTLPSTEWKRAAYRKKEAQKWYAGETISLGIGQGYNTFTMLQLAQATATMAAGGQRHHAAPGARGRELRDRTPAVAAFGERRRRWPWKPEHVAVIHHALYGVTQEGTSAQVVRQRAVQVGRQDRHRAGDRDQGEREVQRQPGSTSGIATTRLYTAFAPLENPRIALALVVENAGFGAGAAAPIARRVFDYVLAGQYPSEADIAATAPGPVGRCRSARRGAIDAVPLNGQHRRRRVASAADRAARRCARRRQAREPAMSAVFDKPSLWQRVAADVDRLRRPAGSAPSLLLAGVRPGDDVFGRLRPRHPLRRPCAQPAARRSACCSCVAQVPAAAADALRRAALLRRRGCC